MYLPHGILDDTLGVNYPVGLSKITKMKKENLDRKVEILFTESDFDRLRALASTANMTISRYVRTACFNRKVEAKFTDQERAFFRNLSQIGNNLNQIARSFNSQILDSTIEFRLMNSLDHLDFFINKLLKDDSQDH